MKINNKRKLFVVVGTIVLVVLVFAFILPSADATDTRIPDSGGEEVNQSTLPGYIKALYNWALAIVGVSALIVVIFGGYQFMTSAGNSELRKLAKKTITQALVGLAVALSIFLVLNLIDPRLVELSFTVPEVGSIGEDEEEEDESKSCHWRNQKTESGDWKKYSWGDPMYGYVCYHELGSGWMATSHFYCEGDGPPPASNYSCCCYMEPW